jgi:hypothetical protein
MFLKSEFSNRLVQVSLFSAIVYYITAYPVVFEKARKYFPVKFKKTHHLLLFHTFVFAVLMYVLTYFVFDPLVRVVEGASGKVNGATDVDGDADTPIGESVTEGDSAKTCNSEKVCDDGMVCVDGQCTTPASSV